MRWRDSAARVGELLLGHEQRLVVVRRLPAGLCVFHCSPLAVYESARFVLADCPGCPAANASASTAGQNYQSVINCCGANRDDGSPLCGSCGEGFEDTGGTCVECTKPNTPMIVLFFFITLALCVFALPCGLTALTLWML